MSVGVVSGYLVNVCGYLANVWVFSECQWVFSRCQWVFSKCQGFLVNVSGYLVNVSGCFCGITCGVEPPRLSAPPGTVPTLCSPPARLISEGRRVGGALGVRVQR